MVEFPKLGLRFEIDRVAFVIFEQEIYWYGILIAAAFMTAILLALRECSKFGIEQDTIIDLVLFIVPSAIVGARLYYVIFAWDEFKDNIWSVFNTRRGGLALYGGVIASLLVAYLFARWKKIKVWKLMDFGVVYIPIGQAIGRWGNFVNQEAFGTNTTLPWGMTGDEIREQLSYMKLDGMNVNPDLPVHPTFLYESLWNIGVFIFLHWYRNRKKADGEVIFLYLILYGLGRFWIEGLRTDSLMLGNIRISQLLSLIFVVVFSFLLYFRRKKASDINDDGAVAYSSEYGNILKKMKEEEEMEAARAEGAAQSSDGEGPAMMTESAAEGESSDTVQEDGGMEDNSEINDIEDQMTSINNSGSGDDKKTEV